MEQNIKSCGHLFVVFENLF